MAPAGLPRVLPAASLKLLLVGVDLRCPERLPRVLPAASLKLVVLHGQDVVDDWSSAGPTRGLIEACRDPHSTASCRASSAGPTRGLIEAGSSRAARPSRRRLPRVLPAASLKRLRDHASNSSLTQSSAGPTRGLIEARLRRCLPAAPVRSSAGPTRGLIEASPLWCTPCVTTRRLPRVLPAASLKRASRRESHRRQVCLPRVLPAASLKRGHARSR